jgi:hypothetical protein
VGLRVSLEVDGEDLREVDGEAVCEVCWKDGVGLEGQGMAEEVNEGGR